MFGGQAPSFGGIMGLLQQIAPHLRPGPFGGPSAPMPQPINQPPQGVPMPMPIAPASPYDPSRVAPAGPFNEPMGPQGPMTAGPAPADIPIPPPPAQLPNLGIGFPEGGVDPSQVSPTVPPGMIDSSVDRSPLGDFNRSYDTQTLQMDDALRADQQNNFWASIAQGFGANPFSIAGGMGASAPGMAAANAQLPFEELKRQREIERMQMLQGYKELGKGQTVQEHQADVLAGMSDAERQEALYGRGQSSYSRDSKGNYYETETRDDGRYYKVGDEWLDETGWNQFRNQDRITEETRKADVKQQAKGADDAARMAAARKKFPQITSEAALRSLAEGLTKEEIAAAGEQGVGSAGPPANAPDDIKQHWGSYTPEQKDQIIAKLQGR